MVIIFSEMIYCHPVQTVQFVWFAYSKVFQFKQIVNKCMYVCADQKLPPLLARGITIAWNDSYTKPNPLATHCCLSYRNKINTFPHVFRIIEAFSSQCLLNANVLNNFDSIQTDWNRRHEWQQSQLAMTNPFSCGIFMCLILVRVYEEISVYQWTHETQIWNGNTIRRKAIQKQQHQQQYFVTFSNHE